MTAKQTGGAAFPQIKSSITAFSDDGVPLGSGITGFDAGMTRRQWYAGLAMQGLLAGDTAAEIDEDTLARLAWSQADKMLETEDE